VSDTSADNVPEGSKPATLGPLIEEMRAATSGDINAAIPKSLAKRALAAGLINQEDMAMAPIARMAMKDAVDAYDAQPAPEQTTAAPSIEEVAVDLKVAAAREAAAKLKDAQLPSIDEGLPETPVSTSEQARVQRTATKAKMEPNQAEREATRLAQNQQAAQQAEALRTENAAQYRQGDLPLSLVPAEYAPMTGALGMGKEAPEGADPQVIPAPITVPQAPITPEKQVEPVTEKLWKEMGFSRTDSKLFFDLRSKTNLLMTRKYVAG
jgi:hypothetical protein